MKYNLIICGSSNITNFHIEAINKIENINIKGIYSGNKKKVLSLSNKYNIKLINDLDENGLKDFNIALITSSTEKHFYYIEKLSKYIKNFIVEKPIIVNKDELNFIKNLIFKKYFIREVSFFYKKKIKNSFSHASVNICKFRDTNNYVKSDGKIDIYKSTIYNHLPHWYDFAFSYLGHSAALENYNYEVLDNYKNFISKISLNFRNSSDKKLNIIIDYNCKKNENTIKFNDEKIFLKIFSKIINFFNQISSYKYSIVKLKTKNKLFYLMYKDMLNEIDNSQNNYFNYINDKINFINKLKIGD